MEIRAPVETAGREGCTGVAGICAFPHLAFWFIEGSSLTGL
jgi:hypothetical protein